MSKIKSWLQACNGWKRLWLVVSVIGFMYMTIINPFVVTNKNKLSSYQYRWAVEKELKNPDCKLYSVKPFAELKEPEYQDSEGNSGCYHIYNYRKYHNQIAVPYTEKELEKDFFWELWSEIFAFSGLGAIGALFVSFVIYCIGLVVAWVLAGFKY